MSEYKNRIVGTITIDVNKVMLNPKNWREHPESQMTALGEVLNKVGVVQNIIINRTTGTLLDGHARVKRAQQDGVGHLPAIEVELTQEEEDLMLMALDPLSSMALPDHDKLEALYKSLSAEAAMPEMSKLLKEIKDEGVFLGLMNPLRRENNNFEKLRNAIENPGAFVRLEYGEIMVAIPRTVYDKVFAQINRAKDKSMVMGQLLLKGVAQIKNLKIFDKEIPAREEKKRGTKTGDTGRKPKNNKGH